MRRKAQAALHAEADKIEPRMARAFVKAAEKLRELVPINALAQAIHQGQVRVAQAAPMTKDIDRALALIPWDRAKEAFAPVGAIAKDCVMRGRKAGTVTVKRALA
jgi:predicted nucleotidyltransferase